MSRIEGTRKAQLAPGDDSPGPPPWTGFGRARGFARHWRRGGAGSRAGLFAAYGPAFGSGDFSIYPPAAAGTRSSPRILEAGSSGFARGNPLRPGNSRGRVFRRIDRGPVACPPT